MISGAFETAAYHEGAPTGVNFPINKGLSYLVSMEQDLLGFVLPAENLVTAQTDSPIDGAVLRFSPVEVSGTVTGEEPITVTVADVPAMVAGTTYSAFVPLTPGPNRALEKVLRGGPGTIQRALEVMERMKFRDDPRPINTGLPHQDRFKKGRVVSTSESSTRPVQVTKGRLSAAEQSKGWPGLSNMSFGGAAVPGKRRIAQCRDGSLRREG